MRLPLFPLGVVLFPEELMPLHIFEQRYLAMISQCVDEDQPFGIVCTEKGKMAEVGCTARIRRVLHKYPDGRLDILIGGEQRFEIENLYDNRVYLTGDIRFLSDAGEAAQKDAVERVVAQHMRLIEIAGRKLRPSVYDEKDAISYQIARSAGLTLQQKQAILEFHSERERIAYLISHLDDFIPRLEVSQALQMKIQSNGHLEEGSE